MRCYSAHSGAMEEGKRTQRLNEAFVIVEGTTCYWSHYPYGRLKHTSKASHNSLVATNSVKYSCRTFIFLLDGGSIPSLDELALKPKFTFNILIKYCYLFIFTDSFLFSLVFTKTKYEASTFFGCLISRMGRFYVFRKLMFAIGKAFFGGNEFRNFQKLYTEFFCL